jgi:hypothetical protein
MKAWSDEKITWKGWLGLVVVLWISLSWGVNVYRLTNCDFDTNKSWKGEAIHAIGVITPSFLYTAWNNFDEGC